MLRTVATRVGSHHSTRALRGERGSYVSIHLARAGFATSIPPSPNVRKRVSDTTEARTQSVESYVVRGDVLHSTDSGDPYIIPQISLFRIRQALYDAEIREIFVVNAETDSYMRTLIDIGIERELEWSNFESFVVNFEALRLCFLALQGTKSKKLGELYPGAIVGQDKSILDLPIPISTRSSLEYLKVPFVPNITTAEVNKNKVLVLQSGCADVAIPFGGDSFIFLDFCNSMKANSSFAAYAGEKLNLIETHIQSVPVADRPKKYILALISIQGPAPEPADIAQLPPNVIMMRRDQLFVMFGEMFAARGRLVIDECANMNVPLKPVSDPIKTSTDSSKPKL